MRKIMPSILMLILILATPLSVNAFTDVGQNPYEEAIDSLSNSGVIEGFPDGTFKPDQAVNRAQFAAMVTRYLGVSESTLASFSNSSFKDMAGYYWAAPYLAYCQQEKIMLGDGKGNAMPGRTISYDEAITMVIRALDLEKDLDEELEWPSSYLKLAKEIGLTNGITDGLESTNRGVAAQLLFNGTDAGGVQANTSSEQVINSAIAIEPVFIADKIPVGKLQSAVSSLVKASENNGKVADNINRAIDYWDIRAYDYALHYVNEAQYYMAKWEFYDKIGRDILVGYKNTYNASKYLTNSLDALDSATKYEMPEYKSSYTYGDGVFILTAIKKLNEYGGKASDNDTLCSGELVRIAESML